MILKPPRKVQWYKTHKKTVFLAGSIEMGAAENWQAKAEELLVDKCTVLNPRRDDWDSSWVQDISNPQFKEQVEWELEGIERSDAVIVYFDPSTKSPITLLELGILSKLGKSDVVVVCPPGFWRKGNVDIVCNKYSIRQIDSIEEACKWITR